MDGGVGRAGPMRRYELTDDERALIEPLIPLPAATGRPRRAAREMWNPIFWVLRSGAPWRDLPDTLRAVGVGVRALQRVAARGQRVHGARSGCEPGPHRTPSPPRGHRRGQGLQHRTHSPVAAAARDPRDHSASQRPAPRRRARTLRSPRLQAPQHDRAVQWLAQGMPPGGNPVREACCEPPGDDSSCLH
jgi:transposase